jgi:hypothetical protein
MKIVGCDLHTRYQQIAMLDTYSANEWALRTARVTKGRLPIHDQESQSTRRTSLTDHIIRIIIVDKL